MNSQNINIMKIIKIAVGCCAAILLAKAIGLQNSSSAGVITLLSIQDTKKETLFVAVRRILAFFFAYLIALCVFSVLGFETISFGVFLLLFLIVCSKFHLEEGIAMNTVLITHFLIAKTMDFHLTVNELFILFIGIGIGVLINLYMPNQTEAILQYQQKIDASMQNILKEMAEIIIGKTDHTVEQKLNHLEETMNTALTRAYENMNNTLASDMRYYVEYIEMRMAQCALLHRIYTLAQTMQTIPSQAYTVSNFLRKTAISFHEYNNAYSLLFNLHEMKKEFRQSLLPKTREEFETRAILFQMVNDIEYLLLVKKKFSQALSQKQINTFWKASQNNT